MIYVKLKENSVEEISFVTPTNLDGWVAVDGTLPPRPTTEDDIEPRLMLVDGELVWITGKTDEELSEERRLAYEQEADRYLIAMHGYEVEGKSEEAENCRRAYLAKKAEIRKRFS